MRYVKFMKSIVSLATVFLVACSGTDNIVVDANEAGRLSLESQETGGDVRSNAVPSLDEAKKKDTEIQNPKSDEKKSAVKAGREERIAQVKEIMHAKLEAQKKYEQKQRGDNPNAFYRFKREKAVIRPLIDDGVHDPSADLGDLQSPIEALKQLPEATFGNGVNWVDALAKHKINPRADQSGSKSQFTLDMNIPMSVPGTMNDVLFPHKAHTAWLACSNCHTGIFKMQRGGNPITMRKINNGEYCGVCHGKVAFPIADCNRCHSVRKQATNSTKQ